MEPVVGYVRDVPPLVPDPREVSELIEIPLRRVLDGRAYQLRRLPERGGRAYYVVRHEGAIIGGPTVSVMIGFYEALAGL